MPMHLFNAEKCAQRNRIAAGREEVEAIPFQLFRGEPDVWMGHTYLACTGHMPTDPEAALAVINERCALEPLTLDQVYLHWMEAGNNNFVGDRFCFLDSTTLENIAADAYSGFAFMNSHATGSVSTPAQLPFGRTFGGRYEKAMGPDGKIKERALVGFYMIKGVHPAGSHGPSTCEMSQMIKGGTLFDVSPGLYGGTKICDVCGKDLNAYTPYDEKTGRGGHWDCPHVPGTTWEMTEAQIAAQMARGVTEGCASYSLVDAHPGETSGVYDGAIPGAGFKKLLSLQREGALSNDALAQGHRAYRRLISKGDSHMPEETAPPLDPGTQRSLFNFFRNLFGGAAPADTAPPAHTNVVGIPAPQSNAAHAPEQETRLAAVEAQNAALVQQNTLLMQQFATLQSGFGDSQNAARIANFHTEIAMLVRLGKMTAGEGEQWKAKASEKPDVFAEVLPTLKERQVLPQFSETRKITAATGSPTQTLMTLSKQRQKETGVRLDVAMKQIAREQPELAMAHYDTAPRAGSKEGTN